MLLEQKPRHPEHVRCLATALLRHTDTNQTKSTDTCVNCCYVYYYDSYKKLHLCFERMNVLCGVVIDC